jgi:hypothetical protein
MAAADERNMQCLQGANLLLTIEVELPYIMQVERLDL